MGMSEFYGDRDDAESTATISRALDLGVTFLDTADMYGLGDNETLVGAAIAGRREEVTLGTKFGIVRDPAAPNDRAARRIDGRPDYIRAAIDRSLTRLGVEYVELYYQHRPDPQIPIEDSVGAMAELVRAGKVRYLGPSEVTAEQLERAHAVHPITAVQSEYSLWTRDVEEVLPTMRRLGVGLVAYAPLGRGFLTGTVTSTDDLSADDFRRANPRFAGGGLDANAAIAGVVRGIADTRGVPAAQVALAWVRSRGADVVAIPGTKRRRWLEQNVGALELTLTGDELSTLEPLAAQAAGARY
ncbi:MAG: aldo/keto reductase [Mycobacteriales bacterium]